SQMIRHRVMRIDGVVYTHNHADHVFGLDDLRRFNYLQKTTLTCYGDEDTLAFIDRMFPYAFRENHDYPSAKPRLKLVRIDGPLDLFGVHIVPIRLFHGDLPVWGFRIGRFAYCTDCSRIPDESLALLADLDVFVLDALRRSPHPTHFNLEQAVEAARRIAARQTYFTHIAHELPHEATNAELPAGLALAYDGLVIHCE
ncbi:MAG: MBL fold metallo-hydrolase, partial [bacterium]|nr:MBL fold metallo-hydrolase [bacterium]